MTWEKSYVHTVLLGLDMFGAAVLFNQTDITISSMCRLQQMADYESIAGKQYDGTWTQRYDSLKLWRWQHLFLRVLAIGLDKLQTAHCEGARCGDINRANRALKILE